MGEKKLVGSNIPGTIIEGRKEEGRIRGNRFQDDLLEEDEVAAEVQNLKEWTKSSLELMKEKQSNIEQAMRTQEREVEFTIRKQEAGIKELEAKVGRNENLIFNLANQNMNLVNQLMGDRNRKEIGDIPQGRDVDNHPPDNNSITIPERESKKLEIIRDKVLPEWASAMEIMCGILSGVHMEETESMSIENNRGEAASRRLIHKLLKMFSPLRDTFRVIGCSTEGLERAIAQVEEIGPNLLSHRNINQGVQRDLRDFPPMKNMGEGMGEGMREGMREGIVSDGIHEGIREGIPNAPPPSQFETVPIGSPNLPNVPNVPNLPHILPPPEFIFPRPTISRPPVPIGSPNLPNVPNVPNLPHILPPPEFIFPRPTISRPPVPIYKPPEILQATYDNIPQVPQRPLPQRAEEGKGEDNNLGVTNTIAIGSLPTFPNSQSGALPPMLPTHFASLNVKPLNVKPDDLLVAQTRPLIPQPIIPNPHAERKKEDLSSTNDNHSQEEGKSEDMEGK